MNEIEYLEKNIEYLREKYIQQDVYHATSSNNIKNNYTPKEDKEEDEDKKNTSTAACNLDEK